MNRWTRLSGIMVTGTQSQTKDRFFGVLGFFVVVFPSLPFVSAESTVELEVTA